MTVSTTRVQAPHAEAILPKAVVIVGDVQRSLRNLHESVQCVVTSPPYWGLRDYGVKGQLGLERSPWVYIERVVAAFREVRRVLRKDGTLWLNMGDSYATGAGTVGDHPGGGKQGAKWKGPLTQPNRLPIAGLKSKDMVGMPWRIAFALQQDGWYLRQDIIWSKPNAMPESVVDRCTKSHEYIFLLTKSRKYFYDADAIREEVTGEAHPRGNGLNPKATVHGQHSRMQEDRDPCHAPKAWKHDMGSNRTLVAKQPRSKQNESFSTAISRYDALVTSRNKRSVWEIATQAFPDAHFATFPEALIAPCILAGTSEKGCCSVCGKPFTRLVEKRTTGASYPSNKAWDNRAGFHGSLHRDGRGNQMPDTPVMALVTVGWKQACKCDAVPVPCLVLDPFCGAGTAGVVALRYGREFIGVELKMAYAQMAAKRIDAEAPLFNSVEIQKPRRKR